MEAGARGALGARAARCALREGEQATQRDPNNCRPRAGLLSPSSRPPPRISLPLTPLHMHPRAPSRRLALRRAARPRRRATAAALAPQRSACGRGGRGAGRAPAAATAAATGGYVRPRAVPALSPQPQRPRARRAARPQVLRCPRVDEAARTRRSAGGAAARALHSPLPGARVGCRRAVLPTSSGRAEPVRVAREARPARTDSRRWPLAHPKTSALRCAGRLV